MDVACTQTAQINWSVGNGVSMLIHITVHSHKYFFEQFFPISFQLQLWMENPKQQIIFENALPQIEAPYNSKFEKRKKR